MRNLRDGTRTGGALQRAALVAEIIGGFAVVISVVYLGFQISDNTRLLKSQSHYNALELLQIPFEVMLESDSLVAALEDCEAAPFDVPAPVWSRCVNYYFIQANGWEYTFYQEQEGALPPELWPGVDGYFSNEAQTNPGWVRFWEETALGFGEPFRSRIEALIRRNPAYRGGGR